MEIGFFLNPYMVIYRLSGYKQKSHFNYVTNFVWSIIFKYLYSFIKRIFYFTLFYFNLYKKW